MRWGKCVLHYVQQQLHEAVETEKAKWEECVQQYLKEQQEVSERGDQKRSNRLARSQVGNA
jgi:hypothetical protein